MRSFLAALWLVCGVLASIDHRYGSGVAFGVGLLLLFGALMIGATELKTGIGGQGATVHLFSALRTQ